jgi:hypothetical protein
LEIIFDENIEDFSKIQKILEESPSNLKNAIIFLPFCYDEILFNLIIKQAQSSSYLDVSHKLYLSKHEKTKSN